ncbi:hypothetical protein M9Y10_042622 [Tritrichomonas musculus]|uniref:Uncharacterized protein n=1 Tax=Tritrichomonas musculus TaxID=1915356 RepID=A0ABR2JXE0_9EUKA
MKVITTSNMTVFLAGLTRELIVHRNTALEIHPWAIKRGLKGSQAYRYITVDNGNFDDHSYNLKLERLLSRIQSQRKSSVIGPIFHSIHSIKPMSELSIFQRIQI